MYPTLMFDGERTDAATLAQRAERAAAGFAAMGIREGDVIAAMLRNEPVFLEVMYAARALGAYLCPVNWHFKADEAGYVLRDSGAKAFVVHTDLLAQMRDGIPEDMPCIAAEPLAPTRRAFRLDPPGAPPGWPTWAAWRDANPRHVGPAMRPRGIVPYTSGTTGRPKGVRRIPPPPESAARMAEDAARISRIVFGLDADSRALLSAPLYHSAPASYLSNVSQTGCTLYLEPRFDAERTLALIERERVTHAYLVPTMYQRMLRLPAEVRAGHDVSSIRFVCSTGSPCPPEVKRAMIDWWGPVINECYASSETGYVTFIGAADWLAHPGSAGRAVGDAKIRILDDDGRELPAGEVGTIHVYQPAYPDFTYIGNDEARRRMEREGLVSVGDMGWLDAEGYLYISDRKSDMVISGGVNIYPAEIESVLHEMPGIGDCAVFGIPDEEFGEALAAAVTLREGFALAADDVRRFLAVRIAGYKVPRVVTFHDALPREDTGKIFKRLLREPYWAGVARRI